MNEPAPIGYEVTEQLDGHADLTYFLTVPGTMREWDISSFRVERSGGPNDADRVFRRQLYMRIGAVTVAGGHVETAMKRLLLLLRGVSSHIAEVDLTWTRLHTALAAECRTLGDSRHEKLREHLSWAEERKIGARRNDVIHAYWWIFDGVGARRSRHFHGSDGSQILATLTDIDDVANDLFTYASRLDSLLGNDWPQIMLPS